MRSEAGAFDLVGKLEVALGQPDLLPRLEEAIAAAGAGPA